MFWKKSKKNTPSTLDIIAPVKGQIIALSDVKDEVFSQKMMGDGFAIVPEDNQFVAPISGKITSIFPTGHAYTIEDGNDNELLVHIGIDTVQLKGHGFKIIGEVGKTVKQGEPIIEIESDAIKSAGYDITTPVIFTNKTKQYQITLGDTVTIEVLK